MKIENMAHADSVRLSEDGKAVRMIDQTLLPGKTEYLYLTTAEELWEAIYSLRVRGAPAIGICAAYSMYVLSLSMPETYAEFKAAFHEKAEYLNSSRPTAVNLSAMLRRMETVVEKNGDRSVPELRELLKAEAEAVRQEDIAMCLAISEYGLSLVKDGDGVLTHCNAGPLATSRYGTAQGPFFRGHGSPPMSSPKPGWTAPSSATTWRLSS